MTVIPHISSFHHIWSLLTNIEYPLQSNFGPLIGGVHMGKETFPNFSFNNGWFHHLPTSKMHLENAKFCLTFIAKNHHSTSKMALRKCQLLPHLWQMSSIGIGNFQKNLARTKWYERSVSSSHTRRWLRSLPSFFGRGWHIESLRLDWWTHENHKQNHGFSMKNTTGKSEKNLVESWKQPFHGRDMQYVVTCKGSSSP